MLPAFCIKYSIKRKDLCDIVQKVVQEDGRINPFTNGRPGHLTMWFEGLCAKAQKKRKRSLPSSVYALTSKRCKELHEAEEQESFLKERRKEKERYMVVRKEREKEETNEGDCMGMHAEHVCGNKCKWIQC